MPFRRQVFPGNHLHCTDNSKQTRENTQETPKINKLAQAK